MPTFDPATQLWDPGPLYTPPDVPTGLPVGPGTPPVGGQPPAPAAAPGPILPTGAPAGGEAGPSLGVPPTVQIGGSENTQRLEAIGAEVENRVLAMRAQNPGMTSRQALGLALAGAGDMLATLGMTSQGKSPAGVGGVAPRLAKNIGEQKAAHQEQLLNNEKFLAELQTKISTSRSSDIMTRQHVYDLIGKTLKENPNNPQAIQAVVDQGIGILTKSSNMSPQAAEMALNAFVKVPEAAMALGEWSGALEADTELGKAAMPLLERQLIAAYRGGPETQAKMKDIIDTAVGTAVGAKLIPEVARIGQELQRLPTYQGRKIPVADLMAYLRASKGKAAPAYEAYMAGRLGPTGDGRATFEKYMTSMGFEAMDLSQKVEEAKATSEASKTGTLAATAGVEDKLYQAAAADGVTLTKQFLQTERGQAYIKALQTEKNIEEPAKAAAAKTRAELAPDIVEKQAGRAGQIRSAEETASRPGSLAERIVELQLAGQTVAPAQKAKMIEDVANRMAASGAPRNLPIGAVDKIGDLELFSGKLSEMSRLYHESFTGPWDQWGAAFRAATGIKATNRETAFRQLNAQIRNELLLLRSGAAVTPSEYERILKELPVEGDPDNVYRAKLAQVSKTVETTLAMRRKLYSEFGFAGPGGGAPGGGGPAEDVRSKAAEELKRRKEAKP